ncbi:peptidoglycan -binding protein [Tropicimonas sp. S265A]|uniref:peptidoglycan -binding protein n=1 Tax=Tropicimonas sp. S265A TaxID=3415134 RepID=UPI003C7D08FB
MALSRRFTQRATGNIWPGFVDAMTALLLVLMFVLTIFMVVQSVLAERILDQDTELDSLTGQLSDLANALGLERVRSAELAENLGQVTATLEDAEAQALAQSALIATLTQRIDTAEATLAARDAEITAFEDRVAALLSQNADLSAGLSSAEGEAAGLRATLAEVEAARDQALSEAEALNLTLATLREEIDVQTETARLAAARADALDALVADLRTEGAAQETRLADLLASLERAQVAETELSETLAEREAALEDLEATRLAELAAAEALRARLADTEGALSEAEVARLAELAAAEALRTRLENADAELTAMTLALEERRREAEETLTLLAAAEAAVAERDAELETLSAELTEAERDRALLAVAETELSAAQAQTAAEARRVALLNEQVAALRQQLGSLEGLLAAAEARDEEAQIQLQSLGNRLNTALAQVASEQRRRADLEEAERLRLEEEARRLEAEAQDLAQYQSEFFRQLRDLLGDQEGVRIEGDRFVFASSVLFETGAVALSPQGQEEVAKVAEILISVADQIPDGIDWVLRVDGHTDNVPVTAGGKYSNNWELSQGRALSVVEFMIDDLGLPPDRLAPTGFGEFQPVNTADTPEARAQNRRIELKFTEK